MSFYNHVDIYIADINLVDGCAKNMWPTLKPDPICCQEGLSKSQPPLTTGKPGDEFQTLGIQNKKRN